MVEIFAKEVVFLAFLTRCRIANQKNGPPLISPPPQVQIWQIWYQKMQQLLITSFDQYKQLIPPGGRDICVFPLFRAMEGGSCQANFNVFA